MSTIKNAIFTSYKNFFEAEQKVADFILNNWQETMDLTVVELAKLTEVSEATIIRFCKKIGLTGFHQLKLQMAKETFLDNDDESGYNGNLGINRMKESIDNIEKSKLDEITETFNSINPDEMKEIIEIISNSNLVEFAAMGNTIPIALDGSYKFNQLGIKSFSSTIWESQIAFAKGLSKGDTLISISDSGESKNLIRIAKIAKNNGATVILITGNKNSTLSKYSDYIIETFTRELLFHNKYSFTRVSAMSIIDFFFLMLINSNRGYINKLAEHEENISTDKT